MQIFFVPSYFINFQNTKAKLFHIKLIKLFYSRSINLLSQKIFNFPFSNEKGGSLPPVKRKNSFAKKIIKEKPFGKDFQFSSIKQLC